MGYHTRLADRVVAMLGVWLDEDKVVDAVHDIAYHRRQIDIIHEEDLTRDRYDKSYHELLKVWKENENHKS